MATPLALSLTGSGHLLVYQLGACRTLLNSTAVNIQHVAGSSGGAIVTALMAHGVDLEDYANDFIATRGHGMKLLKERLQSSTLQGPTLSICTTRCRDGKAHLFDFSPKETYKRHLLLSSIEASCKIPSSFHPYDIISSSRSYANSDGVLIDEDYYVDGGIAAPAPWTPPELQRVIVSPIEGISEMCRRISPKVSSFRWPSLQLQHDFRVDTSFTNLKALRAAAGMTTSSELRVWYERGQDDAHKFLDENL